MKLEDYAVLGDTQSLALVGRNGSVDWLGLPRFDSSAFFAALLGDRDNGHWTLAPVGEVKETRRRYRRDSLVLETDFHTADGAVRVVDAMPIRSAYPNVVRVVKGLSGAVRVRSELRLRFDYGRIRPWLRPVEGGVSAVAGADAVVLRAPVALGGGDDCLHGEQVVRAGEEIPFTLTWHPSYEAPPDRPEPRRAIEETDRWWREWASRCTYRGRWRDAVVRSLITLKALAHAPSGGLVAAGTTSLPEHIGGPRNWDYRYAWLRDATFTLLASLHAGYRREACAWRDWILRALAGDPDQLQILFGVAGERRVGERTIPWLGGYEGSKPVRVGNAASGQLQLDVYGEIIDALHQARSRGIAPDPASWAMQRALVEWLEDHWREPDAGLWEIRGQRRHHTHSKAMAWVAFDRAVKAVEKHGQPGPAARWARARDEVHAEVCARGFVRDIGAFTQAYGSDVMDASALLLPSVGFLPGDDPRVRSTIEAVERTLMSDGFVVRYPTSASKNPDGLEGREGAFLACSCWLVDAYTLAGRRSDAERLFERVLSIRSDLGLLSEEYDTARARLVGNFPQAFSHVAVVNSALSLEAGPEGATQRARA